MHQPVMGLEELAAATMFAGEVEPTGCTPTDMEARQGAASSSSPETIFNAERIRELPGNMNWRLCAARKLAANLSGASHGLRNSGIAAKRRLSHWQKASEHAGAYTDVQLRLPR